MVMNIWNLIVNILVLVFVAIIISALNGVVSIMSLFLIVLLIFCGIFSILYILSSFDYKIDGDNLLIKWKIFKYLPFGFYKIKLNDIQQIKKFIFQEDILHGAGIWGNLLVKKGYIIILKKGFINRIYITPENSTVFIEQIIKKI